MHSEKEILDALNVIKEVCEKSVYCKDCPLRNKEINNVVSGCALFESSPSNWKLSEEQAPPRRLLK